MRRKEHLVTVERFLQDVADNSISSAEVSEATNVPPPEVGLAMLALDYKKAERYPYPWL